VPALGRILATGAKSAHVTMVIRNLSAKSLALSSLALALVLLGAPSGWAQSPASPPSSAANGIPTPPEHPAEALYFKLRSVGLDPSRVYNIRDVTLDRAAFHITFDDGTIAFTEDVAGHITGAFF
jgi:hypothetical protein